MTTVQTYQGIVQEGKIQLASTTELPEGSQVYVSVPLEGEEIPLLDPHIARRKANGWLVTHVGSVMAQQPELTQIGGRLIWRFKVFLTMKGQSPQGPVGAIAVDAYNGEIVAGEAEASEIITNATTLIHSLSSSES